MPGKSAATASSNRDHQPDAAAAPPSDPAGNITPVRPRRSIDEPTIDLGAIPNVQVVKETGEINDPRLDPGLAAEELRRVYRAMVLTRKLDERMLAMQRQGEMGTFAPGYGQEATEIGQVYPLQARDWFAPSYRSFGAQIWRGWPIEQILLLWDGFAEGFAPPEGVNDLPFSIVIGSHPPVATGVAMAIRARGADAVVLTNFGDGAMCQGAVSESMVFAAAYAAPVIFVCENNGYAISTPVQKQGPMDHLAGRGAAFGIPSMRVDGNDVLAMIAATTQAVERAHSGGGPTFIEAVTYRMSLHTTADDPRVYRSDEEVEYWKTRDPLARFEAYLGNRGVLEAPAIGEIAAACEEEVRTARAAFRRRAVPRPRAAFDFIYDRLPPELLAQREEYFRKLDRKGLP